MVHDTRGHIERRGLWLVTREDISLASPSPSTLWWCHHSKEALQVACSRLTSLQQQQRYTNHFLFTIASNHIFVTIFCICHFLFRNIVPSLCHFFSKKNENSVRLRLCYLAAWIRASAANKGHVKGFAMKLWSENNLDEVANLELCSRWPIRERWNTIAGYLIGPFLLHSLALCAIFRFSDQKQ